MITAVADVEIAVNCLAIGAADYVIKPYQLEDVRARVAQAMEKRRLILENRAYRESLEERVGAAGAATRGAVPGQRAVAGRGARAQGPVHARPFGAREPLLQRDRHGDGLRRRAASPDRARRTRARHRQDRRPRDRAQQGRSSDARRVRAHHDAPRARLADSRAAPRRHAERAQHRPLAPRARSTAAAFPTVSRAARFRSRRASSRPPTRSTP